MSNVFEGAVAVPKATIRVALERYEVQAKAYSVIVKEAKDKLLNTPCSFQHKLLGHSNMFEVVKARHPWASLASILNTYVEGFHGDNWSNIIDNEGRKRWPVIAATLRNLTSVSQSHGEVYVNPSQAKFIALFTK